ncbi:MAG TPA: copper ion binding protein [Candidatus Limnocylindria bacterium]|nr:copper ion binding protein [Candidatus Limnocylindria bacterium]
METMTIHVKGMSCQHCVRAVSGALSGLPGVEGPHVSLEEGTATFRWDPQRVTIAQVKEAVEDQGYEVEAQA